VVLLIGMWAGRRQQSTVEDYYLASRGVGVIVLMMTQAATIFSAFTFYGLPGSAYSSGLGIFGGLFIGSVSMSFLFYIIGYRAWLVGQKYRSLLTPPELIYDRFGSRRLRDVFMWVSVAFVIPYLVMQPIGAGHALNALSSGRIPYIVGSSLITLVIVFYVFYSGMRGGVLIDTFQGFLMFIFAWAALFLTAGAGEGYDKIMQQLAEKGLLARGVGYWTWKTSFSWAFLIAINTAMQPMIFTRFLIARNVDVFRKHFAFYPTTVFCTFPVIFVGLLCSVLIPGIKQADQALATALLKFAPPIMAGFFAAAGMAAMQSTADSQLLIVGSMVTNDLYKPYINPLASSQRQFWVARIIIIITAIVSWLLSLNPPKLLIMLGAAAFTGVAVLAPTGIAAFYWKRATAAGALASILLGEAYVIGFYLNMVPKSWNFGFMPVIPAALISTAALIIVSLVTKPPENERINRYFDLFEKVFK
jgi:SSS family solute:Na+ symporter